MGTCIIKAFLFTVWKREMFTEAAIPRMCVILKQQGLELRVQTPTHSHMHTWRVNNAAGVCLSCSDWDADQNDMVYVPLTVNSEDVGCYNTNFGGCTELLRIVCPPKLEVRIQVCCDWRPLVAHRLCQMNAGSLHTVQTQSALFWALSQNHSHRVFQQWQICACTKESPLTCHIRLAEHKLHKSVHIAKLNYIKWSLFFTQSFNKTQNKSELKYGSRKKSNYIGLLRLLGLFCAMLSHWQKIEGLQTMNQQLHHCGMTCTVTHHSLC